MITKKEYQKVESKMMSLESENRELKYTISSIRGQIRQISKTLELI